MVERLIRLLWTALSAAGAVYALLNWRDAAFDYKTIKTLPGFRPGGVRDISGRANVRRELLRFVAQVAFTAIGAHSILAPPPPPPPRAGRVVGIVGIMIGQLCAVANDLLDRNDRRRSIEAPPYRKRKTD